MPEQQGAFNGTPWGHLNSVIWLSNWGITKNLYEPCFGVSENWNDIKGQSSVLDLSFRQLMLLFYKKPGGIIFLKHQLLLLCQKWLIIFRYIFWSTKYYNCHNILDIIMGKGPMSKICLPMIFPYLSLKNSRIINFTKHKYNWGVNIDGKWMH